MKKRVEPDFDVYPIIDRCKRYITHRLKRHVVKPPTLKAPQNPIVNWLQAREVPNFSRFCVLQNQTKFEEVDNADR